LSNYSELLKDPRWQKKRLEIMERDKFLCSYCWKGDKTLHVHHLLYFSGRKPWEYDGRHLVTVCEDCHQQEHNFYDSTEKDILMPIIRERGISAHFIIKLMKIASSFDDNSFMMHKCLELTIRIFNGMQNKEIDPYDVLGLLKGFHIDVPKKKKRKKKKVKGTKTFQLCKKCNGQLYRVETKRKPKPGQRHRYKATHRCKECRTIFLMESEKVSV